MNIFLEQHSARNEGKICKNLMNVNSNNKIIVTLIKSNSCNILTMLCVTFTGELMAAFGTFKGTVHPKMKILSEFTESQVVTNQYELHRT